MPGNDRDADLAGLAGGQIRLRAGCPVDLNLGGIGCALSEPEVLAHGKAPRDDEFFVQASRSADRGLCAVRANDPLGRAKLIREPDLDKSPINEQPSRAGGDVYAGLQCALPQHGMQHGPPDAEGRCNDREASVCLNTPVVEADAAQESAGAGELLRGDAEIA